MTPTATALDPAVFPADVQAFAAERGVTDYLLPNLELVKQCFPEGTVTTAYEEDGEEPDLSWIIFQVAGAPDDADARHAAYFHYLGEMVRTLPPDARGAFAMRLR
jgi:hypothetical protein